ncbi:hypothetical protein BH23GEM3_BH23GEM3_23740 [soil metagenome]|nr:CPBP family intramembrane metalloprotease [Gemmatimonadota bacterium]
MIRLILRHLVVFLFYTLGVSVALLMLPPLQGLALGLLLLWLLLRFYLLPSTPEGPEDMRPARRLQALRLRPLRGEVLRWTLVALPVMLVLSWSVGELYVSLVPVPAETFNPFGPLIGDPWGQLAITVLAVVAAPVAEEFFFRGVIQHPLEQRWGAAAGILGAAALFALVHLLPWVFPLHFFLGAVFGWVVYTTRSIWSGVIFHAGNNALAVLGLGAGEDPLTRPTLWEVGLDADWWLAMGVLVVSLAAAIRVAGHLRSAARREEAAASPHALQV